MLNFVELLNEKLEERDKSIKDLEDCGVIPKNSFYQYKTYTPFLPTVLKIANFLEMSLDYFVNRTPNNNFKEYNLEQHSFFDKLQKMIKFSHSSQIKLAKNINIGRTNFSYWKNGSLPKLITLVDIANDLGCFIDDLLEHK